MTSHVRFSVLIPVYNVESYIDECIQSVLSQTYTDYEMILVDDGSTDKSGVKCDQYALEYPQIKVIHKKNQGLIHTRRVAIEHASGEYYVMLDSDDMIESNALEILNNAINRHQCDCVFFNRKLLIDKQIRQPSYHISEGYFTDRRTLLRKTLIEIPYNAIVLKCAKATLFSDKDYSGFYHIQKGEDLLQSLELLSNCSSMEFIDDPLYIYRMREGSITKSTGNDICEVDFSVRKITLDYIRKEDVFTQEDYDEYRGKCICLLVDKIVEIGTDKTISSSRKKQLYETIRNDRYYTGFLAKGHSGKVHPGYKKILFRLFRLKYDRMLMSGIAVYSKFRA